MFIKYAGSLFLYFKTKTKRNNMCPCLSACDITCYFKTLLEIIEISLLLIVHYSIYLSPQLNDGTFCILRNKLQLSRLHCHWGGISLDWLEKQLTVLIYWHLTVLTWIAPSWSSTLNSGWQKCGLSQHLTNLPDCEP